MADIRPLGQIQTVQVEVEPNVGGDDITHDEEVGESENKDGSMQELPSPSLSSPPSSQERPLPSSQEQPSPSSQEHPLPSSPEEQHLSSSESLPSPNQLTQSPPQESQVPSLQQSSAQQEVLTPTGKKAVSRQGEGIPPPSLPTVAEGLEEAARRAASTKKKPGKVKPLSVKDLIPLHQDVGRSTKQLLEPSTPEFKPTADWVG